MCNRSNGDQRNVLTHKAVLLLSANRELNLKKRKDLIRPDLNKQYASLCNPSTAVSTFLFGDDLNKEVEELTKSHKVSSKVTPRKRMEPYKAQLLEACVVVAALTRMLVGGEPLRILFLGSGRGQARHQ